jgi:hypothetical protein
VAVDRATQPISSDARNGSPPAGSRKRKWR